MTQIAGKKLLIAPLDWGLGHTTRCMPVINDLLKNDCEVWLAGNEIQEKILRKEFPGLQFLPLDGYNIKYGSAGLRQKLLLQIPSILKSIKKENKWLDQQVKLHGFEVVISDNRFGLYNQNIHSIFITHQLKIKSDFGKWSERVLQNWNYKFINRFNECWVPDEAGEDNLAGELSHPEKMPEIPFTYIGHLSRFQKINVEEDKSHLLIIISGPERQRTIFENKIVDSIAHYPGTATIVRGLPAEKNILPSTNSIRFFNHLSAAELNEEAMRAEFIISRCGYSTIMDIAALKKKSILVPTPGQTEQEYLADHLYKKSFAFTVAQKHFDLLKNFEAAKSFNYKNLTLRNLK